MAWVRRKFNNFEEITVAYSRHSDEVMRISHFDTACPISTVFSKATDGLTLMCCLEEHKMTWFGYACPAQLCQNRSYPFHLLFNRFFTSCDK